MRNLLATIGGALRQAFAEMRAAKLRTALSLSGITIGIFCIITVYTVLDSMQAGIRKQVSSLGSDVVYIGRWPWLDEAGEYKWWEFIRRPSMTLRELRAVQRGVPAIGEAALCLRTPRKPLRYAGQEQESVHAYAVTQGFDRLQGVEISDGRYLSTAEADGGAPVMVLGGKCAEDLFPSGADPVGKQISYLGKRFTVVGTTKRSGQDVAGFDFDRAAIIPYNAAASAFDLTSLNFDPMLIVKAAPGAAFEDMRWEVEGVLRRVRRVRPGAGSDFAVNQLSQISERLDTLFVVTNAVGSLIGGFALLVGAFGIANIMFVTVKERTKIIGLKKAVGAPPSTILLEFLTEASALCIVGGLAGLLLVWGLALLLTHVADFPTTLTAYNAALGVAISAIVGLVAGYVPARRAARLDAVVAIRTV